MDAVSSHTDEWAPLPLDIPLHWEQIDFEDAFENISLSRLKVPQKDYLSSGAIPIIDQGFNLIGGFTNDTSKSIQSPRALIVFGDHTKCFKLIRFRFAPGADGIKVLKPVTIDERFAYYACRALRLPDRGYSRHYSFLKKSKIPLPSQNEQLRIVAKIEELLSELDKGIESFKTAREQLTVYRQAVLKHAFEGKLTEEWRKKHAGELEPAETLLEKIKAEREQRYQQQLDDWKQAVKAWEAGGKESKKPTKPSTPKELPLLTEEELSELPELPEGWRWIKLSNVTDVSGGITKNAKRAKLEMQVPYLRVANVYANDLRFDDIHNIGVEPNELKRTLLEHSDLLIVEGNGSKEQIGRAALWNGKIKGCVHQNHLIKARPFPQLNPNFALHFLLSNSGRDLITEVASSTSGLYTLNISKVEGIKIPFLTVREQDEIVKSIESRLSAAERLEQEIDDGLTQAKALRQSLLKKAFEGRLVRQDPNDEPANVLLERIRTEKLKLKKKARKEKEVTA